MTGSEWTTPRQGIAAECQRRGQAAVAGLRDDDVPRVRIAAERAVAALTASRA